MKVTAHSDMKCSELSSSDQIEKSKKTTHTPVSVLLFALSLFSLSLLSGYPIRAELQTVSDPPFPLLNTCDHMQTLSHGDYNMES